MVVGKGMLAKRFFDYENDQRFLLFASGVSDSSEKNQSQFEREKKLLLRQTPDAKTKTLVYFSTCSINDPSLQLNPYVLHKLNMEKLIQDNFSSYIIFRVSNPIGFTANRHTVFNYFIDHILAGSSFTIWTNAQRNILDIDDMFAACKYFLELGGKPNKLIQTIANPQNYPVTEIVAAIEKHFYKSGNYQLSKSGGGPQINKLEMEKLFRNLNISFGPDYLEKILKKYFSNDVSESFTQKKD